jgi:hypothetical protein
MADTRASAYRSARLQGATEATEPRQCPPGVHSIFDPCPGDCDTPADDDAPTRPSHTTADATPTVANTMQAAIRKALAIRPTPSPTQCGQTSTGMFGRQLGPCTHAPLHPEEFHRDAHGAEWRDYEETTKALRAERDRLQRAVDAVRRLNELTADSVRVQAAEHARDNLALLDSILGPRTSLDGQH